jgi:hypothetical protein
MPIPKPQPRENRQDYVGRCMGDKTMVAEYEKQDQRAAICHQTWRDHETKQALEAADAFLAAINDLGRRVGGR